MKKSMVLAFALCALPALAQSQSASVLYGQLTSRDALFNGHKLSTDDSRGFALRYGHDIASLPRLWDARLAFEGTWMPRTSGEDVLADGKLLGGAQTQVLYRHEYLGLGLSVAWTKTVDFGAALELRHESNALRIESPQNTLHMEGSITRPWLSLRGGYTFAAGSVKPFVALECNLALAKKQKTFDLAQGELGMFLVLPQNLNPKSQFAVNAGVRF